MTETALKPSMSKRIYQRQIPVFLVAFLAGILIIEYFVGNATLKSTAEELVRWGTVISLFTMSMAIVFLVSRNVLSLSRGISKHNFKGIYNSMVFLGTYAFFIVVGISDPRQLTNNQLFTMIYTPMVSYLTIAISGNSEIMSSWMVIMKMGPLRSLEGAILFITWFIGSLYLMTMMHVVWPQLLWVQNWVDNVLASSVQRAVVGCAGISVLVLSLRAIAGKEPGLIEMEVT